MVQRGWDFLMNSLSTDTYPYSITYVSELLKIEEAKVLVLCNSLGVQPRKDERNGRLFLSTKDVDTLKKAVLQSSPVDVASSQLPQRIQPSSASPGLPAKPQYSSVPQRTSTGSGLSRVELSAIVESVSSAKEEILRDLSQLLDDKLSGLDEVVVELIRSKSENDTLREELKRLEESQNQLQSELSKFKPAAFGFYRKDS